MKKITSLLLILNIAIVFSQAGAPAAPYYNGFNWTQTGTALKDALATKITNTHTNQLSYNEVWSALKIVDKDPANAANVFLIYGWETGADADVTNDKSRDKNNNGGSNGQWNREHIFAQALGNPDLGQTGPGADAHMLRACDVQRNGSRANKLYTGGSGNSGSVGSNGWYPGDEWKGDVARIIMYMYLHYGEQCKPTFVTSGTTAPTDVNMVNLLLDWNTEDPVSAMEDYRNTYLGNASNTYGQGNRNPFIDNPYLATLIWGGPIAQNRWPAIFLATPTFNFENQVAVYPNPSADGNVTISSEIQLDQIDVTTINGQVIQEIKNPVIANASYSISNLQQGFYFIKLSYNNQSVTKKVIVN